MNNEPVKLESNGANLSGVYDFPDQTPCPIVIPLHGGTNTKEDCPMFDRIVPLLNENGIATFRFDFFGTGESDGLFQEKTQTILDANLKDAIECVASDSRFTHIGLLGRSISGGQVLFWSDERIKTRVVHSASIYPFADISRFYPDEIKDLISHPEKDVALITSDPRKVNGRYGFSRALLDGFKLYPDRAAKNMPKLTSVCVFQGDADPETTVEEAIEIYQTVRSPKELHVISGANHKYVGTEEEVSYLTVSWFRRTLL